MDEFSKKQRGVNDLEYEVWCNLSENPSLVLNLVLKNPKLALKFFYNFMESPFGNEITQKANSDLAKKLGNKFVDAYIRDEKYGKEAERISNKINFKRFRRKDITKLELEKILSCRGIYSEELFGLRIKKILIEKNKVAKDIEKESGFSCFYLYDLIHARRNPELKSVDKLCRGLGVTLNYLMKGDEDGKILADDLKNAYNDYIYTPQLMGKRLRELIKIKKLANPSLKTDSQVKKKINYFLHGDSIKLSGLDDLCNKCDIYPDYLFYNVIDDKKNNPFKELDKILLENSGKYSKKLFILRLKKEMLKNNISTGQLKKEFKIKTTTFYRYLKGEGYPPIQFLEGLCKKTKKCPEYFIFGYQDNNNCDQDFLNYGQIYKKASEIFANKKMPEKEAKKTKRCLNIMNGNIKRGFLSTKDIVNFCEATCTLPSAIMYEE